MDTYLIAVHQLLAHKVVLDAQIEAAQKAQVANGIGKERKIIADYSLTKD